MSKLNLALTAALLWAGLIAPAAQLETPLVTQTEDQWIAVLKSNAPQKEKADACRELAVIGTQKAVAALAALLPDAKMNHMARYGLETIPDPSVDDALRAALSQTKGRALAGVIGSIGVRHDAKATDALAKLLSNADADVAQAAARSLGKIATAEAAKALEGALAGASAANQLSVCEGLFRCADAFAAQGQAAEAGAVYDTLRAAKVPHQVRAGGLRGAILTRGKDGLPLLMEALRGNDWILVAAAARTAMEMPGAEVTQAVAAELGKGSADKQVLLTQVLGKRGDQAALPALFTAAKSGDQTVRLAAVRALPEIGGAATVPVLVGLLNDADREIGQTAQESLAALKGAEADAAVLALLDSNTTQQQLAAIELIGRRRMTTAVPALLKAGTGTDAKVRPAAMIKVGELAGAAELPALLEALAQAKNSHDLDAIEQALSTVCARAGQPEACTDKIIGPLAQANPEQKCALLRVLSAIGGPAALKAVRAAVDDSNADVHAAAIRALGSWKTPDAAPDLLTLAQNAANPTDRLLCLRSYMGLADQPELPVPARLSMCKKAAVLLKSSQEKKLLLGTLGGIHSPASFAVILPYLSDAEVKSEASAAALGIAENLLQGKTGPKNAPLVMKPLQEVAQAAASPDLAKRAQALLRQAQSKSGKK